MNLSLSQIFLNFLISLSLGESRRNINVSRIPFSMAGIPSIKEGVQIQTANTVSQNKTLNLPAATTELGIIVSE